MKPLGICSFQVAVHKALFHVSGYLNDRYYKCNDLIIENDSVKVMREVFGGLANLYLNIQKKPYVITVASSYLRDMPSETGWDGYERISNEKSTLTFELLDSKKIEKTVDLTRADRIVSVGRGIDKDDLERIFVPFYTTKSTGTGLGLAISKRIAEEHGGELLVASEPGTGTTFTLKIPTGSAPSGGRSR